MNMRKKCILFKNSTIKIFSHKKCFKYSLSVIGFLFINSLFTPLAGTKTPHQFDICFFELGNTKTSDNFIGKRIPNTTTHRYQMGDEESGPQAFERMINAMIESKQKCDGFIFSGHHTGDWFGGEKSLRLKDLEALSCKKKYRDWFNSIKVLWLDGCNTITDNFIQPGKTVKTPDSETVRVAEKDTLIISEGEKKKDITKLSKRLVSNYQQAYAASLNEFTPLSSRYLRMLPNAQIYAFSSAAPAAETKEGKDQIQNQSFIYNHMTNLIDALKAEEQQNITEESLQTALEALFSHLCDDEAIKAWEMATDQASTKAIKNRDYKKAHKLGCDLILAKQVLDNPNSPEAQEALVQRIKNMDEETKKILNEAQKILNDPSSTEAQKALAQQILQKNREALELANNILKNPNSKEAIELAKLSVVNTLRTIDLLSEKDRENNYFQLLFSNLYDTWETAKKYQTEDSRFFNDVKTEFQKDSFTKPLEQRIESNYTASLRKGDYIKFYTELHDIDIHSSRVQADSRENCFNENKEACIKGHILKLLAKAKNIFQGLRSPQKRRLDLDSKRALAVSVVDQLFQYNLLSRRQIRQLLNNEELFPEDTNITNPFVMNVKTELRFNEKPARTILDSIRQNTDHSLRKRSEIQAGTTIFLNQGNAKALDQLANSVNREKTDKKGDRYAFLTALHEHLRGKTDEEKIDVLFNFSKDAGENLRELISSYAYYNLNPKIRQQLHNKITPLVITAQTETRFRRATPQVILDSIGQNTDHSLRKRIEIQAGTTIFLNQGNAKALDQLANSVNREKTDKKGDRYAFLTALHKHLRGKTDEEKIEALSHFIKGAGENLRELIASYAYYNINPKAGQQIYNSI